MSTDILPRPLGDRVKVLSDLDWEEIRQNAYAMVCENETLTMDVAELHAMLAIIELREQQVHRRLH